MSCRRAESNAPNTFAGSEFSIRSHVPATRGKRFAGLCYTLITGLSTRATARRESFEPSPRRPTPKPGRRPRSALCSLVPTTRQHPTVGGHHGEEGSGDPVTPNAPPGGGDRDPALGQLLHCRRSNRRTARRRVRSAYEPIRIDRITILRIRRDWVAGELSPPISRGQKPAGLEVGQRGCRI